MAYFPSSEAHPFITDSPHARHDAFGRQRVVNPISLFDSQFQYDLQPLRWQTSGSVGTSVTLLPNESSVNMVVPGTANAALIRQTYEYFRYQPGKSQFIVMTGVFSSSIANVTKRIGYYDEHNGVFFQFANGGGPQVVLRSYISGSVNDTVIDQANWNLDTLDGTLSSANPSGITLDMSQAQIFVMDFQWLGVGRVRFGFDFSGDPVYCHSISHANLFSSVYMTTANLPLRYEIFNSGSSTGASMKQVCSTVISEGGVEDDRGIIRGTSNGTSVVAVTTRRPILSIQPVATFGGQVNHAKIQPLEFQAYVTNAQNVFIELVYNGALTGATFANAIGSGSVASLVDADVAATAINGGMVVAEGYIDGGVTPVFRTDIHSKLPFTLDMFGTGPATYTIVATSFGTSANVVGAFKWKENY